MTPKQIKYLFVLLNKAGLADRREDLCLGASNGRTTHASELTASESAALIKYAVGLSGENNASDRMRKKILSMAHEMGWETAHKVDMERINGWCSKFGYLHKPLDQYSYQELPKLVSQFEGAYIHFLKTFK